MAKVIMGLSSQNQLPTHLLRDAGLLRRIGSTAKQVEEGFCQRGKGLARSGHIRQATGSYVGQTSGRSRNGHPGLKVPIKDIYLYPLTRGFREELSSTVTREIGGG